LPSLLFGSRLETDPDPPVRQTVTQNQGGKICSLKEERRKNKEERRKKKEERRKKEKPERRREGEGEGEKKNKQCYMH
jgi:hypothetical protein